MPTAQANRPAALAGAGSELHTALASCRAALIAIAMFSGLINLLSLTGSLFMLEVYDRVLPSRSIPTLIGLIILASFLYMAQGVLDMIRNRILGRIGTSLDEALNKRVFDTIVRLPLLVGSRNEGLQPLRDLGGGGGLEAGLGEHLPRHPQDVPYPLLGLGAGRRAAQRDGGGFFHGYGGAMGSGQGLLSYRPK
jgi:hypothetical protein